MQIDKPEGNEPIGVASLGEVIAPLPPEPPQPLFEEEVSRSDRLAFRRVRPRSILGAALVSGVTIAAALIGRAATTRSAKLWYRFLKKPSWTPPQKAFSLVWPVLYSLSAVSAWRVWRAPSSKARSAALGLWGVQMATNALWPHIFFGAKKPRAALLDLQANLGAASGYALTASRVDRTAALLMTPYVAWMAFAGTINADVARRNRWLRVLRS
jgi:translocator protein